MDLSDRIGHPTPQEKICAAKENDDQQERSNVLVPRKPQFTGRIKILPKLCIWWIKQQGRFAQRNKNRHRNEQNRRGNLNSAN
jgi:hypothetical protein